MILEEGLGFPDPEKAVATGDLAGLVALGGDLSVPRLLLAYQRGIFPWTVDPITWWSPDPRAIFPVRPCHVSRSFGRFLRRQVDGQAGAYTLTVDQAFRAVMEGCAAPAGAKRRSTWIAPAFLEGYGSLHEHGYAHSVECWDGERLVGGLYGVAIGGLFAAESMFHRADNASKLVLWALLKNLERAGFLLFDIQMLTPHTASLGAITIPRAEYLGRLKHALGQPCAFPTTLSVADPPTPVHHPEVFPPENTG